MKSILCTILIVHTLIASIRVFFSVCVTVTVYLITFIMTFLILLSAVTLKVGQVHKKTARTVKFNGG